jgi:hypothetical protein
MNDVPTPKSSSDRDRDRREFANPPIGATYSYGGSTDTNGYGSSTSGSGRRQMDAMGSGPIESNNNSSSFWDDIGGALSSAAKAAEQAASVVAAKSREAAAVAAKKVQEQHLSEGLKTGAAQSWSRLSSFMSSAVQSVSTTLSGDTPAEAAGFAFPRPAGAATTASRTAYDGFAGGPGNIHIISYLISY